MSTKTIKIQNGTLNESTVVDDGKPRGDGAGTQNEDVAVIITMQIEIEAFLEEKYDCFKTALGSESERKEKTTNSEVMSGDNIEIPYFGFPLGPGKIGDNRQGKKRGYAGRSNLFVGVPDKRAEELSEKLKVIKLTEKEVFTTTQDKECKEPD